MSGETSLIYQKEFDDIQWKLEIQHANEAFTEGDLELAYRHYLEAKIVAKQLFIEFNDSQPLPDALVPALVISYLNLADCRAKQGNNQERRAFLIEIYEYLKRILSDSKTSDALSRQVYQGLSKVHPELCVCLKAMNDLSPFAMSINNNN